MDPIGSVFPFSLFDKKWFESSIVSVNQSNASMGGGSKSRNGFVAKGAADEGGKPPFISRTRSHVPDEAEMRKVFERFDENKDGVICSDELSRFMKRLGFEMSNDDVQALVKTVDENCNGTVDFAEFYSLYSSLTAAESSTDDKAQDEEHEQNLKNAFRVFDKDGDGFISVLELQSVLLSLGMQEGRSLKKCEQMIRGVDADGNGKVCFKEFKKLMSSDAFQS